MSRSYQKGTQSHFGHAMTRQESKTDFEASNFKFIHAEGMYLIHVSQLAREKPCFWSLELSMSQCVRLAQVVHACDWQSYRCWFVRFRMPYQQPTAYQRHCADDDVADDGDFDNACEHALRVEKAG